jgi:putative ABC transport system substrate-binding protein
MLNITLVPIPFSNDEDLSNVPDAVRRSGVPLLIASDTPLLYARRKDLVQFAAKSRLPVVYAFREAVEEGGLMALSTDLRDLARRAAGYVDRIFRGAYPGDLPVEQPTRLQFTVNLKTAKALGLTIPPSLLLRADQVIE